MLGAVSTLAVPAAFGCVTESALRTRDAVSPTYQDSVSTIGACNVRHETGVSLTLGSLLTAGLKALLSHDELDEQLAIGRRRFLELAAGLPSSKSGALRRLHPLHIQAHI